MQETQIIKYFHLAKPQSRNKGCMWAFSGNLKETTCIQCKASSEIKSSGSKL